MCVHSPHIRRMPPNNCWFAITCLGMKIVSVLLVRPQGHAKVFRCRTVYGRERTTQNPIQDDLWAGTCIGVWGDFFFFSKASLTIVILQYNEHELFKSSLFYI